MQFNRLELEDVERYEIEWDAFDYGELSFSNPANLIYFFENRINFLEEKLRDLRQLLHSNRPRIFENASLLVSAKLERSRLFCNLLGDRSDYQGIGPIIPVRIKQIKDFDSFIRYLIWRRYNRRY
jgi:hypothetical protein